MLKERKKFLVADQIFFNDCQQQLIENDEDEVICPECGARMYKNGWLTTRLKDIPCGKIPTVLGVTGRRHHCPYCRCDIQTRLEFKAAEHLITQRAALYAEDLLRLGLTLKDVTEITGLGINVVKDIDKKRLAQLYTVNGDGKTLIKPERQATKLGVDEFLLHEGRKFAPLSSILIQDMFYGCLMVRRSSAYMISSSMRVWSLCSRSSAWPAI